MNEAGSVRAGLRERWLVAAGTIILLIAGTVVVYQTGGTSYAWPYVMFVPILVAAAWMGIPGGVVTGIAAGLLLGPSMPFDVASGQMQSVPNWLTRLAFFVAIGGFAGGLFRRLEKAADRVHLTARSDRETQLPNQFALQEDLANVRVSTHDGQRPAQALILLRAVDLPDALEAIGADAPAQIFPELGRRFAAVDERIQGVYRFSHSEIAVWLAVADEAGLAATAGRLRDAAEQHVSVRGVPVRLEMVAGAALASEAWIDADALIRQARIALFAAVDADDSYRMYTPLLERGAGESVQLIARLSTALDAGELTLWYQPKVRLATGQPAGCEGLIRWITPDSGVVLPGKFMPKVERTSLITPVTEFVSRTACGLAAHPECLPVSINFSVRNLFDTDMRDAVERLLGEYGMGADQLEIEITERALIRNPAEAEKVVRRYREMGVRVSIDDFGTGYSSFEYLRRLPVTGLKIDRVFVRDLENDKTACDLLRCMVEAGHTLDLEVTAEGVETPGQHRLVRELGCDVAQGFLYARPMPLDELQAWMRAPDWQGREAAG